MQSTSALYQTIIAGDHWFETRLIIDGVGTYGETDLFAMSTTHEMFHNSPTIGSAVAGEITVKMVYPQDVTIPAMAKLLPQVRACNATQQSEWISQGVYYIDTRERTVTDYGESVLELHGYDAMRTQSRCRQGIATERCLGTSRPCMSVASSSRTRENFASSA